MSELPSAAGVGTAEAGSFSAAGRRIGRAQSAITANGEGIRPFTFGEDEETFVLFVGTEAYRDLKTDLETVHKDAREQFEMRIHKRLIDILNPAPKVIEALTNLNLPSGVTIDVKMV